MSDLAKERYTRLLKNDDAAEIEELEADDEKSRILAHTYLVRCLSSETTR